jgi:predicted O-methyltransferase YrrM
VLGDRGAAVRRLDPRSRLDEDEVLLEARDRAEEFACRPVRPSDGAALCFLATALRARAVVEIGTGTGVSGLWLLRGMVPDAVLTSIDVEREHQRAARAGFRAAGHPPGRVRLITGRALDVLPRLADGVYDLVFLDAVPVEYPRCIEEAVRMLRPGGVLVAHGVHGDGEPGTARRADPDVQARREVMRRCHEHEALVMLPVPLGGLLAAARRDGWAVG